MREKPGGVALRSSADVAEEVIQVSVRAKQVNIPRLSEIKDSSEFHWIEERANIQCAHIKIIRHWSRVELDVSRARELKETK